MAQDESWWDEEDEEEDDDAPGAEGLAVLTFSIAGRRFGVRIDDVSEITSMPDVTPLPETAPWLPGVATVRDRVVPVILLRMRLGLPAPESGPRPCVVVTRSETLPMALVMDDVCDVVSLPPERIQPPPPGRGAGFVTGLAHTSEGVVLLLAPEQLLNAAEQDAVGAALQAVIDAAAATAQHAPHPSLAESASSPESPRDERRAANPR